MEKWLKYKNPKIPSKWLEEFEKKHGKIHACWVFAYLTGWSGGPRNLKRGDKESREKVILHNDIIGLAYNHGRLETSGPMGQTSYWIITHYLPIELPKPPSTR